MVTERELKDLIEQVMSEMGVNEKDNEKQEEVLKAVLDKSGIDDEDIEILLTNNVTKSTINTCNKIKLGQLLGIKSPFILKGR